MPSRIVWLACLIVSLFAVRPSGAHENPGGCFQTGAVILLSTFRSDGTTGIVGVVSDCETIQYQVRLQKAVILETICAFSGGSLELTTPDGISHSVNSNVPCIGGAEGEGCDPTVNFIDSDLIPYTVRVPDVVSGYLLATASYSNGVAHDSPDNTSGVFTSTLKTTFVRRCRDQDPCTLDSCDPEAAGSAACSFTPHPLGCSCGNGVLDEGEACDAGDRDNGEYFSCCSSLCQPQGAGNVCRSAAGACDVAETCDGVHGQCPGDVLRPADTLCNDPGPDAPCDSRGFCTGTSPDCPPTLRGVETVCRPADPTSPCDDDVHCDGLTAQCPALDAIKVGVVCRPSASMCDEAEQCRADVEQPKRCPVDGWSPRGAACGPSRPGDVCDGNGAGEAHCLGNCGNGTLEPDLKEQCDDGNQTPGDGCRQNCQIERAGDGILDPQEQCDPVLPDPTGFGCDESGRLRCASDADCSGRDRCARSKCEDGLCATNPGCRGDSCVRPLRFLDEGTVGLADVQCAFMRRLGGVECGRTSQLNRIGATSEKIRRMLEAACAAGKPKRIAGRLRRLAGRIEKLQLRIAGKITKQCADELNLDGGGLYDRVLLLRALAARVQNNGASTCP